MSLTNDEMYVLDIIDQLTWCCYTDYGPEKTNSFELSEVTGFGRTKINIIIIKLQKLKYISNSIKFTGSKSGWFVTKKGHNVVNYWRAKEEARLVK